MGPYHEEGVTGKTFYHNRDVDKLLQHPFFNPKSLRLKDTRRKFLDYALKNTALDNCHRTYGAETYRLKKSQFVFSVRGSAKRAHITMKQARNILKFLCDKLFITRQNGTPNKVMNNKKGTPPQEQSKYWRSGIYTWNWEVINIKKGTPPLKKGTPPLSYEQFHNSLNNNVLEEEKVEYSVHKSENSFKKGTPIRCSYSFSKEKETNEGEDPLNPSVRSPSMEGGKNTPSEEAAIEIYRFLQHDRQGKQKVKLKTVRRWINVYDYTRILSNLDVCLQTTNVYNFEAWMETALKENFARTFGS